MREELSPSSRPSDCARRSSTCGGGSASRDHNHRPSLLSRASTSRISSTDSAIWIPTFAGATAERMAASRAEAYRSPVLTIFWHCSPSAFSSRTAARRVGLQRTVNGFGRRFGRLTGSGNADSQRKVRSSGWSGRGRPCNSGCVGAHPPSWRASASYRPLRAVWAVCAWALRGCARTPKPFSAHRESASTQKEAKQ
jgi:hypothetical protein